MSCACVGAAASGVYSSSASTGQWQWWVGASAAEEERDRRAESRFDIPRARHAGSVALTILGRRRVHRVVASLPHSNIRDGNIPPARVRESSANQQPSGAEATWPHGPNIYIRTSACVLSNCLYTYTY